MPYRSAAPARYECAGRSITGHSRGTNEDAWATLPAHGVYLVVDGCEGTCPGRIIADRILASIGSGIARGDEEPLAASIAEACRDLGPSAARGSGATVAALRLRGGLAVAASLGGCRVYRYRQSRHEPGGELTRLTGDHPFVRVGITEFEPADVFLLCTDGLTHQLEVGAIRAIVAEERLSLAGRCDLLVRAADEGVGEDNVTAVLVRA